MRTPDTPPVPSVLTVVGEHELERRVCTSTPETQLYAPGDLTGAAYPLATTWVTTSVRPRYRRPNDVLPDALPDDCR